MRHYLLTLCFSILFPLSVFAIDFEGSYECQGIKRGSGSSEWTQQVTVDASDPNKLWFHGFFPMGAIQPVYGIVSEDQKSISIPVGQLLKVEDDGLQTLLEGGTAETAYGRDVSEGGNIEGTITEADGKVTITIESWYSARCYDGTERTSWWYGAMQQGVTFTKDSAIQEAVTPAGIKMTIYVDEETKTCTIGTGKGAAIALDTEGQVTIPEVLNGYTVTGIAYDAFFDCSMVTVFEIPKTVTSIDDFAFGSTTGLEVLLVDPDNPVYTSINNAIIEKATMKLVAGCINTKIPDGVKTLGRGCFFGCKLIQVNIPASVTEIQSEAFSYCERLSIVNFAEDSQLKTIGNYTFCNCPFLLSFTIPETVEYIGMRAFSNSGIQSIVIPASVTKLDMGGESSYKTFNGCEYLKSIVVAEGNQVYDSRDNCNAIIETATNTLLVGCKGSHIPEGVTTIGNLAFSNVALADGFTIPTGVTTIGSWAFYYTSNLSTLTLPEGLTTIMKSAFNGSSDLTTVSLPSTLTELGNYIFYGCDKLLNVTSHIQEPTAIDQYSFSNYEDAVLFVPVGTKDVYSATEGWNLFGTILEEGESLPWVYLGEATFTDNFLFEDSAPCKVYQSSSNPYMFRLTNPYGTMLKNADEAIDAEYSEDFTLTLLQPNDKQGDVTITMNDLVYFSEIKTGYRYTVYDAVICLLHPGEFSTLKYEDEWTYNKVLSYQESGLPAKIQLAPNFFMYGVGGFNKTQSDDIIIIDFPISEGAGIKVVHDTADAEVVGCYSIGGQQLNSPQRGLNILKLSDGRAIKVLRK